VRPAPCWPRHGTGKWWATASPPGDHQVGSAAGDRIHPDVLLAEHAHEVHPIGHDHRTDPVAGSPGRCRDRHLPFHLGSSRSW
jgi:hypothetical protein